MDDFLRGVADYKEGANFVWVGPDRIVAHMPEGDTEVDFCRFADAAADVSADAWYPLGGFR